MAAKTTNLVDLGTAESFNPWPDENGPHIIYYDQKVWDSGGGGRWCYYTQTQINPAPAAIATVPNWSGTLSTHVLLAERLQ